MKVVPFKMPLKGEHGVALQTLYSIERIGLPSLLARAAGRAPSSSGRRSRHAGAAANPVPPGVPATDLVHTSNVEVGQARLAVPSTSPQDAKPQHEARRDEPRCDSPAPHGLLRATGQCNGSALRLTIACHDGVARK
jgi:hypothetical protein